MVKTGKEPPFREEARTKEASPLALGVEHLHGATDTERGMLDFVHLCHAAFSEQPHNAISTDRFHAHLMQKTPKGS